MRRSKASTPRLSPPEARFREKPVKGHGRIESRSIIVNWTVKIDTPIPYIMQTFQITRVTTDLTGNKRKEEVAYGITSHAKQEASPEKLLALVRGHWAIENSSHYVRDVTMAEDRSRIRKGSAPRVMATIRNLVISLFRLLKLKNIAKAIDHFAWSSRSEALKILRLRLR